MNHAIRELHTIRMMAERREGYTYNTGLIPHMLESWINKYVREFGLTQSTSVERLAHVGNDKEKFDAYEMRNIAAKIGIDLLPMAERQVELTPNAREVRLRFYVIDCSGEAKR